MFNNYRRKQTTYESATELLDSYVKPQNEIFARHQLRTCRQPGQTLDEYLQRLKQLSKNGGFKPVSAEIYQEESIQDAFISGILSNAIRQRLLENKELDLDTAFTPACSLDLAQKHMAIKKLLIPLPLIYEPRILLAIVSYLLLPLLEIDNASVIFVEIRFIIERYVWLETVSDTLVVRKVISVKYVNPRILHHPRQLHLLLLNRHMLYH